MSAHKTPLVHLDNITEAISLIKKYTNNKTFDEYQSNSQLSDAIHMRLQVIGENCSKLAPELRKKYPQIPWNQIQSLRHIISHDYSIINPNKIWKTLKENLSELEKVVREMTRIEEEKETT